MNNASEWDTPFLCKNCEKRITCNHKSDICTLFTLHILLEIFSGENLDKFSQKLNKDQTDKPITPEGINNLFKIVKQKSIEEAKEQAKRDEEFWNVVWRLNREKNKNDNSKM